MMSSNSLGFIVLIFRDHARAFARADANKATKTENSEAAVNAAKRLARRDRAFFFTPGYTMAVPTKDRLTIVTTNVSCGVVTRSRVLDQIAPT